MEARKEDDPLRQSIKKQLGDLEKRHGSIN